MRFVMRRQGLSGWKIVNVRLPTEILDRLSLSAQQGVMGVETSSTTLYMAVCHAGSMDDGEFDSDLERLGYNIAW